MFVRRAWVRNMRETVAWTAFLVMVASHVALPAGIQASDSSTVHGQATITLPGQSQLQEGSVTSAQPKQETGVPSRKSRRLIRKPTPRSSATLQQSPVSGSIQGTITVAPTQVESSTVTTTESESKRKKTAPTGTGSSLSTQSSFSATTATVPLTTTTPSTTKSTGSVGFAAAGSGGSGSTTMPGRSMQRLATELPGLSQLVSPQPTTSPTAPPAANPTISRTPSALSFSAVQNGSNPAAQSITIGNTGGGTLLWSATSSAPWLMVNGSSSTSGTNAGSVSVSVNGSGLSAGTYSGAISISAGGATNTPQTVAVTFSVTSAPTPTIGLSPTALSFSAIQGGSNPANQTLAVSNSGSGTLSWSVSDNAAWLTVGPTSGSGNGSITAGVNISGLAAGTHTATVTVTASGATNTPQTVPVTLTLSAAPTPTISLSPSALSFSATQGGSNPSNQTLTIANSGTGTLTWSVSDNATWLTLGPTSGSGNGSVTASVSISGLAAGTHTAAVTVAASGATNTPQTIPVTLTVTAAAAPTIGLSPASLSFTATQGAANPTSQTLQVTNPGTGTLTWSATGNASWLTLNPAAGTTTTETDSITVSVNTADMTAGTYNVDITITSAGATNTPQTIPVALTLNAPATSSATLTWNANTESDLAGYKVYQATASGAYGAPIATLQPNTTTYAASGLQMSTTYYFVVTAFDTAGNESAYSNEVSKSIF